MVTMHSGSWVALFDGQSRRQLEQMALPAFLNRQRWFGGKARSIRHVRVIDWAALMATPPVTLLVLLQVEYEQGNPETYFLPLGIATGPPADALAQHQAGCVVARLACEETLGSTLGINHSVLSTQHSVSSTQYPALSTQYSSHADTFGILFDALFDDVACRRLLDLIAQGRVLPMQHGVVRGCACSACREFTRDQSTEQMPVVRCSGEQSNSSVIYGDRMIAKIFRRVESGTNPDLEIGRLLTERARFDHVPKTLGAIEYHCANSAPYTLVVLQALIPNQGNGWEQALGEVSRYLSGVVTDKQLGPEPAMAGQSLLGLSEVEPPGHVQDAMGWYLRQAGTLGTRTAELHLALGHQTDDAAFAPEPLTLDDIGAVTSHARQLAERALTTLRDRLDSLPATIQAQARPLLAAGSTEATLTNLPSPCHAGRAVAGNGSASWGMKVRCHGDYHLGQVLCLDRDYVILDFEGEPGRSLDQRRAKTSPLKDVAGMLRSFSYAASAGLFAFSQTRPEQRDRLAPWARLWENWACAAFLRAYRQTVAGAPLLPETPKGFEQLLKLFMLDKAFYELLYELNNRPEWVRIPLCGILGLSEASSCA